MMNRQPTAVELSCECGHEHGIDRSYARTPGFEINPRCWHDNGRCPCRVFRPVPVIGQTLVVILDDRDDQHEFGVWILEETPGQFVDDVKIVHVYDVPELVAWLPYADVVSLDGDLGMRGGGKQAGFDAAHKVAVIRPDVVIVLDQHVMRIAHEVGNLPADPETTRANVPES